MAVHSCCFLLNSKKNHQGYSFIEFLMALFLFVIGISGAIYFQFKCGQLMVFSHQHTIGIELVDNLVERIRSNSLALSSYRQALRSKITDEPKPDCYSESCDSHALAIHDVWEWQQLLNGDIEKINNKNNAALMNAQACILQSHEVLSIVLMWGKANADSVECSPHAAARQGLQWVDVHTAIY